MMPLTAIPQMMPSLGTLPTLPADSATAVNGLIPPGELQRLAPPDGLPGVAPAQPSGGSDGFSNLLGRMVGEVNARQAAASAAVHGLQSGENVPLHQAVIAMEEASVSFQLMVEVRNKLLESYQELMRMQI